MASIPHNIHHTLSDSCSRYSSILPSSSLPGFEEAPVSKSQHYAFIKGPQELTGKRIDDPVAQKIILDWLEREREKGHKLVGTFETSLCWIFEVIPNSVRFMTDD